MEKLNIGWNRLYSIRSYVRSSLWIVPVLALIAALVLKRLAECLGGWMVRQGFYDLKTGFLALSATEAHAFLDRIFTLSLTCLVFTFGSLLVAIQVAGGQYTPRIIATTLLRDKVIRRIVGLFVFTLLWANRTMVQLGNEAYVPQFQVFLVVVCGTFSIIAFIVLIDYCAKLLRPVNLVRLVGKQGLEVIESVYPDPTRNVAVPARKRSGEAASRTSRRTAFKTQPAVKRSTPDRVIHHSGMSGTVLAVNLQGLVTEAQRADTIIEIVPQVGDFLAVDEPLFYLYGNAEAIDERRLLTLIALGSERTMEQDPMFSFRIEVDIALKALSPAINDPTTAVLAIDQLHRLLRKVGNRSLRAHEITDNAGQPRVVFRTPNWEDFVHITFREIRQCGVGSIQIARRLRAMALNLIQTLPEHRRPALIEEMDLLDRAIAQQHMFPEDAALARIPDSQGLGGASLT
ncbi:MAG TPA: DUF2254 domain-containing protein [Thermodesulfovibrionales bacterium]|nr:DUF2254 domain-containing protein [Thermodesulfovibrionales bacterium]